MDVDQGNGVQNVDAPDMVGLRPECGPIKIAPLANLGVDQDPQQGYDHGGDQGSLVLHAALSCATRRRPSRRVKPPLPRYRTPSAWSTRPRPFNLLLMKGFCLVNGV